MNRLKKTNHQKKVKFCSITSLISGTDNKKSEKNDDSWDYLKSHFSQVCPDDILEQN